MTSVKVASSLGPDGELKLLLVITLLNSSIGIYFYSEGNEGELGALERLLTETTLFYIPVTTFITISAEKFFLEKHDDFHPRIPTFPLPFGVALRRALKRCELQVTGVSLILSHIR